MDFQHRPVLLIPTVDALVRPDFSARHRVCTPQQAADGGRIDGVFVDATFGRGGHARELLGRLSDRARLFVFDKDPQAIAAATQLAHDDDRVTVVHSGFAQMRETLQGHGVESVNGIMLDLGISSPQIDDAGRGFSFMRDGPLDMRMDTTRGLTAAQWLADASIESMQEVIATYGEERFASRIAKAIAARRATKPILTTLELAELVASVVRTREKGQHPATRTFQALRIHVNQELQELAAALASALSLLAPGARMAVISFHSLEDRMVKQCIASAARPAAALARLPLRESEMPQPIVRALGKVQPDAHEVMLNPRARSAVLRVAERTDEPLAQDAARFVPALPGRQSRRAR